MKISTAALALLILVLTEAIFAQANSTTTNWQWQFNEDAKKHAFINNDQTPQALRSNPPSFAPELNGRGLIMNKVQDVLVIANRGSSLQEKLPKRAITLSAWVAIERKQQWGGIISCVQDNGNDEKGFVLGYNESVFTFALSSTGVNEGKGKLTYLNGKTPFKTGIWYHLVGTYDGSEMRIYVNGQLENKSSAQSGDILYDMTSPFVIGSYRDSNEDHPLDGRILMTKVKSTALGPIAIKQHYDANSKLVGLNSWTDQKFEFLVAPYLTWPTTSAISILFESTRPSTAKIHLRREDQSPEQAKAYTLSQSKELHELRITGLAPNTKYFYRVTITSAKKEEVKSPLLSFRTAASKDRAFTFVVIGDSQTNGEVAKRVSDIAHMHRPNFVVHAGDLVDSGHKKDDWTHTFFPSMQPLISHSPLLPVLGNHEQDAPYYYKYMSLPAPERWYSTVYGNAEFFMIDGNRSLKEQSKQLKWLRKALADSKSLRKFAVLHQPPYTSDSNDYGNTAKGPSTRGDTNVQNIVNSLEEFGVDICFSGHVHDYERTFPIKDGRVTPYEDGGVIYVTAAGGGGSLEDFDKTNTWFGHKKARYHHLVYVGIHGDNLEFQAIDERGRLFDMTTLKKRKPAKKL